MATKRLFRDYLKWAREFQSEKFRGKLVFNIREAFDAEIYLLNDVNAPRTIQTQRELRYLLRSVRSRSAKNFRPPATYTLDGVLPLSSEEEQLDRGRRILTSLRSLSQSDHKELIEFLLDEQHFTAPKSSLEQQRHPSSIVENQASSSTSAPAASDEQSSTPIVDIDKIMASAKVISNRNKDD
jgi:hypothetical protein